MPFLLKEHRSRSRTWRRFPPAPRWVRTIFFAALLNSLLGGFVIEPLVLRSGEPISEGRARLVEYTLSRGNNHYQLQPGVFYFATLYSGATILLLLVAFGAVLYFTVTTTATHDGVKNSRGTF